MAIELNPSTSAKVIRELSKNRKFVVRESVVFNEQCTMDILK